MGAKQQGSPNRYWSGRQWITISVTLAVIAAALAASIGAMLETKSGELMLVLAALWVVGAGAVGHRLRSWRWPLVCPLAMLGLVLLWELRYGPASWASTFVFMLGVVYVLAAAIGASFGTWIGKMRHSSGGRR